VAGRMSYDEAMTFSSIRLKIQDEELKQGKVEVVVAQTIAGEIERPWGIEGGFAVVYKFRTRSGQLRALRCFRATMNPDMQFRYERIGPYFHAHIPNITAGFKYHKTGIVVKEPGLPPQGQVYPLIEMDWIDGTTLIDKIDDLCRKGERAALKTLSEQWLIMVRALQVAKIAHGDLAGQNVMVRSNGQLVLIDYDGVYIPAFAQLDPILVGQPDFQHPQSSQRKFNEHMDAFSALLIYIVLLALSVQPKLWDTYTRRGDKGEPLDTNLLFKERDLSQPQHSPLFKDLEHLSDPHVKKLTQALKRACAQPIDQMVFPFHLIDPEYEQKQALELLKLAIAAADDERIAASWIAPLEKYPPAQKLRSRAELAQQRVAALGRFRGAIHTRKLAQIVNHYAPILDECKNVTKDERELFSLAQNFLRVYQLQDEDAILLSSDALLRLSPGIIFSAQQQQYIDRARDRKEAQRRAKEILRHQNLEAIAKLHTELQQLDNLLGTEEVERIVLAYDLMQALSSDDDARIIAAYEVIERSAQHHLLSPSPQQRKRITLAGDRSRTLARLQGALQTKLLRAIADAYDPILDSSNLLTTEQSHVLELARDFVQAFDNDNDEALVRASSVLDARHQSFVSLTPPELQRVQLAGKRLHQLNTFRQALQRKNMQDIVDAYEKLDPDLVNRQRIGQQERELARLAQNFRQSVAGHDDNMLLAAYRAIQQGTRDKLIFTPQERQHIIEAQDHVARLNAFQAALANRDAEQIIATYTNLSPEISKRITDDQRAMVESAQAYLPIYRHLQTAIYNKDDREVRHIYVYRNLRGHPLLRLQPDEQEYINQWKHTQELEDALNTHNSEGQRDNGLVVRTAKKLQAQGIKTLGGLEYELDMALLQYIRNCELENVTTFIRQGPGNVLIVGWLWPLDEEIREGFIIYSEQRYPPPIREIADIRAASFPCKWEHAHRRRNERLYTKEIYVGTATTLYVRICAAIREFWGGRSEQTGPMNIPGERKVYTSSGIKQIAQLSSDRASTTGYI
jgi:hypothetical protein